MPKPRSKVGKYRVAMVLGFLIALPFSAYALTINAQPYTTCEITECKTCVNLADFGLNAQRISKIKAMNISAVLPKFDINVTNLNYYWSGNVFCLAGKVKPNTTNYWSMPLDSDLSIDPWWNTTWKKCQNITVTNGKAGHPAYINVTYDDDMLTDFDDIRFLNNTCNNDATELSYFTRFITNSAWATYDLLLDGTQNISVYYNNSAAASKSNITAVWGTGLVAYYTYDEGTGAIASDSTPNQLNASVNGATWIAGVKGNALNFSSDKTTIAQYTDNALFEPANVYTILIWMRRYGNSGQYNRLVEKYLSASNPYISYNMNLYEFNVNHIACGVSSGSTLSRYEFTEETPNAVWQQDACVYNTTHIIGYANGTKDAGSPDAYSNTIVYGSGNFTMGNRQGSANQFTGSLDEVMFFNRSLSSTEISNIYASPETTFTFSGEMGIPTTPVNPVVSGIVCFKTQPVCIRLSDNVLFKQVQNVII